MKAIQLTILTLSMLAVFASLAVYANEKPISGCQNQQAVKGDNSQNNP